MKTYPLIKLSKLERRRLTHFFISVFIAASIWSFFALSNHYSYQLKMLVRYTNHTHKQIFYPLQADTIRLQIEGTGWQVLFSKMYANFQHINIDAKDLDAQNYIILAKQLGSINSQLEANQNLLMVKPDTLFFDFSKRFFKKVPIHLRQNLLFDHQHHIAGKIQIKPADVTLMGSLRDLDSIREWYTEPLKLQTVNHSIATKLALERPKKANLSIRPTAVEVRIPVDEFTEKTVEVPLKILNNSDFEDVQLLPKKVQITLITALDYYPQIDSTLFEANVDLEAWRQNNDQQLFVRLSRFPDYCKLIRLKPPSVDFIIHHYAENRRDRRNRKRKD